MHDVGILPLHAPRPDRGVAEHAGPPAALLGRELEQLPVDDGVPMRFGRVWVSF